MSSPLRAEERRREWPLLAEGGSLLPSSLKAKEEVSKDFNLALLKPTSGNNVLLGQYRLGSVYDNR